MARYQWSRPGAAARWVSLLWALSWAHCLPPPALFVADLLPRRAPGQVPCVWRTAPSPPPRRPAFLPAFCPLRRRVWLTAPSPPAPPAPPACLQLQSYGRSYTLTPGESNPLRSVLWACLVWLLEGLMSPLLHLLRCQAKLHAPLQDVLAVLCAWVLTQPCCVNPALPARVTPCSIQDSVTSAALHPHRPLVAVALGEPQQLAHRPARAVLALSFFLLLWLAPCTPYAAGLGMLAASVSDRKAVGGCIVCRLRRHPPAGAGCAAAQRRLGHDLPPRPRGCAAAGGQCSIACCIACAGPCLLGSPIIGWLGMACSARISLEPA